MKCGSKVADCKLYGAMTLRSVVTRARSARNSTFGRICYVRPSISAASMVCSSCGAGIDVMALVPNLAIRSAVAAFKREEVAAQQVAAMRSAKRRRERESAEGGGDGGGANAGGGGGGGGGGGERGHSGGGPNKPALEQQQALVAGGGNEGDSPRLKGVQFPFAVNDRVLIKAAGKSVSFMGLGSVLHLSFVAPACEHLLLQGNKRTPEKFVGREAIITSQCLNGWYLVHTLDNGESVRLQYRSLQRSHGEGVSTVASFMPLPLLPLLAASGLTLCSSQLSA
eukprot:jgi/Mesen1/9693/ME000069S09101